MMCLFFFQAEDGIRDGHVTGVQTCALPILAANMTAGHMMMVIFVSMLFIFNDAGRNLVGSVPGLLLAGPLSMFMMALEVIVISVQAFVFIILLASYIVAAIVREQIIIYMLLLYLIK